MITQSIGIRCVRDDGDMRGAKGTIEFSYDPADPFVVRMYFVESHVPWDIARDLLDGIDHPTGVGDVRIRPVNAETVSIHLSSPDGEATYHAPKDELRGFVRRTYRAVPRGRERVDLDGLVASLLSGAS